MSRITTRIPTYNPQEGYNIIAKQYKQYHAHLDSFEKWIFQKFIPRDIEKANIIDLWAGDGRIFKYFQNKRYNSYTACDIAEKFLEQHTWNITKIVCDVNGTIPCESNHYAIATSFFVIEHLCNPQNFFKEVYRLLEEWWRYILWYFLQEHPFIHKTKNEKFTIEQYYHDPDTIQTQLENCWFNVYREPVREKEILLWYIRIADK